MRHTSYDELIWTCQDNPNLSFMDDMNNYLKQLKAQPVLIEAPVLVERDPSKDPDLSVATDKNSVYFAIDFPCRAVPTAKYFDGRMDGPFAGDWNLVGILATKKLDPQRIELVPVLRGWADNHPMLWIDVPLVYRRQEGWPCYGDIAVSLSDTCPMSALYISMRGKLDESGQKILDTMVSSQLDLYYVVREFCEFLEGKKLEVIKPKPPKLARRSKTRIKVVKRGLMGYLKVWQQQPKQPTTTTPTS